MVQEFEDKVINLFCNRKGEKRLIDDDAKFFAGFKYVRFDKDSNGNCFSKSNLLEYSNSCHYIVRIMREKENNVHLYNYDVPSQKLYEFLEKFYRNELTGTIIEIEKYLPEDLA